MSLDVELVQRPDLAPAIAYEHEAACQAAQSALEHARRAGEMLRQAKAGLPHGAWLVWLAESCPTVPERTARAYMTIARRWEDLEAAAAANRQRVADLPVREALVLLTDGGRHSEADDHTADEVGTLCHARAGERYQAALAAELRMLRRALDAPDLTVEDAAAICRRAGEVEVDAAEHRLRATRTMGRLLVQVRERWGKALANAMCTTPPDVFKAVCDARIVQLKQGAA